MSSVVGSKLKRYVVTVTTNSSGAGSGSTPIINGELLAIYYVKTDYADTVDLDIDTSVLGTIVYTKDNVTTSTAIYPRVAVMDNAATAVTYDGTNEIYEPFPIANETLDVAVANGGDTKTGAFHFIVRVG